MDNKPTMKNGFKHRKNYKKEAKRNYIQSKALSYEHDIQELNKRVLDETPPRGHILRLSDEVTQETHVSLRPKIYFNELPLSKRTLNGLNDDKKIKLTPIQRASIPHSLADRDIQGSSKTGSGKTLAFVVPVLEKLYKLKWSQLDGLGALVILPTRELSIQVFEVFRKVGKHHDFSLGLIIGGNNIEKEKEGIHNMNILIGTPGRILQHITETPYFSADNLQVLVIDEADRILDEGFEETISEIITYLPTRKQTLMFSATLTKNLKRLAKFSLNSPEYITLHNIDSVLDEELLNSKELSLGKINLQLNPDESIDKTKTSEVTPKNLNQYFNIIEGPHRKLDVLYSFLNTHRNAKCIVFLSSCKQVRFFYEVFRKLKLGFHFLELHGRQKQNKRTAIFYNFVEKTNSVLFATDIAARGMDFPSIDWVIQVDVPEDVQTYIHRVGRTARYKSKGNSLLLVSEAEKTFVDDLIKRQIEIKGLKLNQSKIVSMQPVIRSILSENPSIMYLAQRAIASYIKSIYLQGNKKVFNYKEVDLTKLSLSYGLMNIPHLKFKEDNTEQDEEKLIESENTEVKQKKSKLAKLKEKIQMKKETDDFLRLKRKHLPDNKEEYKSKESKYDEADDHGRFRNITKKLEAKDHEAKEREKVRVKVKHRENRLKEKEFDYEKHNINRDSDGEENIDYDLNLVDDKPDQETINEEQKAKELLKKGSKKLLF